jgi:sRNA-binding protein
MGGNVEQIKKLHKKIQDGEELTKLLTARLHTLEDQNRVLNMKLEDALRSYSNLTTSFSHLLLGVRTEFDRLDLMARTTTYVIREIFGHQTQVDEFLKIIQEAAPPERLAQMAKEDAMAEHASKWYHEIFGRMYKLVQSEQLIERNRAEEAERQQQAAEREAAEQAAAAAEKARMEQELVAADKQVENNSGGPGADYPPEATVYGG